MSTPLEQAELAADLRLGLPHMKTDVLSARQKV